jgi:large subunit ribosomal protein L11
MAKKVKRKLKLNLEAGKANPAPPIGPILGQHGVNIGQFCSRYNEETQGMDGIVPCLLTIYQDRTFDLELKKPPVSEYIKQKLDIEKGSEKPGREQVAELTAAQVEEIAKEKMEDLNARDLENAKKIVAGTAQSMGIGIKK